MVLGLIADIHKKLGENDMFALAGNIAYASLLAFFPFLIFLTALAGFLGNEDLARSVIDYLLSVAPEEAINPISADIHALLTKQSSSILTLSIAFTLYVASGGVESVRIGLNRAYGFSEKRPWWFRRLQNLVFVIGGAFVLLALAVLIVFAPLWWGKAVDWFPVLEYFSSLFHLLSLPVGLGMMFIALLLGHIFLPFRHQRARRVLPGIFVTIGLWFLIARLFTLYVTKFSRAQIMYAGLGNIVIALVFVYISALLILLGAEINQALNRRLIEKQRGG